MKTVNNMRYVSMITGILLTVSITENLAQKREPNNQDDSKQVITIADFYFERDAEPIRNIFNESEKMLWFLGAGQMPWYFDPEQIEDIEMLQDLGLIIEKEPTTKVMLAEDGSLVGFVSYEITSKIDP